MCEGENDEATLCDILGMLGSFFLLRFRGENTRSEEFGRFVWETSEASWSFGAGVHNPNLLTRRHT